MALRHAQPAGQAQRHQRRDARRADRGLRAASMPIRRCGWWCSPAPAPPSAPAATSAPVAAPDPRRARASSSRSTNSPSRSSPPINGVAFGGGLELALACDISASRRTTARFALPEVRIGSMPGSGGTQRLPAVIGPSLAAQMILTGEPIDAERALAAGLVSELCRAGQARSTTAMAHARTIARNAPLAVIAAKRALRVAAGTHRAENLDFERRLFNELALTEDRNEGRRAFREKRQPVVQGEIDMAWRRASIAGVGATRQGKLPGETPLSLAGEAFRLALDGQRHRQARGRRAAHHAGHDLAGRRRRTISTSASLSASIRASPAA